MTYPVSGAVSFNDMRTTLGYGSSAISLNDTAVRRFAAKSSGAVGFADTYQYTGTLFVGKYEVIGFGGPYDYGSISSGYRAAVGGFGTVVTAGSVSPTTSSYLPGATLDSIYTDPGGFPSAATSVEFTGSPSFTGNSIRILDIASGNEVTATYTGEFGGYLGWTGSSNLFTSAMYYTNRSIALKLV